jgi:hypothetical protein
MSGIFPLKFVRISSEILQKALQHFDLIILRINSLGAIAGGADTNM